MDFVKRKTHNKIEIYCFYDKIQGGDFVKNFAKILSLFVLTIVLSIIHLCIIQNTTRQNQNTSALRDAMETAMDVAYISKDAYYYTPANDWDLYTESDEANKLISEFMKALLTEIDSDSIVDVKVINVDTFKGMMDIEVTQRFSYPFPSIGSGTTTCRCTMIMSKDEPVADW